MFLCVKLRVWGHCCGLRWCLFLPWPRRQPPQSRNGATHGRRRRSVDPKVRGDPQGSPAAQFDRFIAENKAIVTVTARPYGSALMWMLEHERKDAALALLRAGSPLPDGAVTLAARGGMDEIIPLFDCPWCA